MKTLKLNKTTRTNFLTYFLVAAAFVILQAMIAMGSITSSLKGMLVPICAYVVMAVSLNLTVGVLGELSLGHAGFMSVGAFTGVTAAIALKDVIANAPLRLAIGMAVGAAFAALAGFLIGIPVLRLKGDYLAIVTLAIGEIIKSIFNNLNILVLVLFVCALCHKCKYILHCSNTSACYILCKTGIHKSLFHR